MKYKIFINAYMLFFLNKIYFFVEDNMTQATDSFNEYDKKYEILQNGAGEILIIIGFRSGGPVNPKIVYDGGSAVLLYRNEGSSLFLTNISQEARQPLQYADNITIAEVQGDEVIREYVVPVRLIKDMKDILN